MTEFDTILKRAFAEAHEPVDDGFAGRIGQAVARRERMAEVRTAVQASGLCFAGATLLYAFYPLGWGFGQDVLASFGLEFARAQGALNSEVPLVTSSVANQAQGVMQSLGIGLTQIMLAAAALTGGAVAYRAAQD